MSKRKFTKYQGTGNDFIMIDHRGEKWLDHEDREMINKLCDRRFGIGADGLILLEEEEGYDFKMVYFNADGNQSTMCGNGGRCVVAFANSLGLIGDSCSFLAIDGIHLGRIVGEEIQIQMIDVEEAICNGSDYVLDTGSPHFVRFVSDAAELDIISEGKGIRYSEAFKEDGINVNFVSKVGDGILVATYERGVEDETLSCGTGVTAAALSYAMYANLHSGDYEIPIRSKGGNLKVSFAYNKEEQSFANVWLIGQAKAVFNGEI